MPSCETDLLNINVLIIPKNYDIITTETKLEFWYPLDNNKRIFVVKKPQKLTLHCGSSTFETIDIERNGILKLKDNCKCYTDAFVLQSTMKYYKNFTLQHTPYHIHDDCCFTIHGHKKYDPVKLSSFQFKIAEINHINHITHTLDEFKKTLAKETQKTTLINYNNWISTIISIIVSLATIFITYRILLWCGLFKNIQNYFSSRHQEASSPTNGLCLKIFNTNVNSIPRSRSKSTEIKRISYEDHHDVDEQIIPLLRRSNSREQSPLRSRSSKSREPSIIME